MTTMNVGPIAPSLQYTTLEALLLSDGSELCFDDRGDGPALTFVNSPLSVAPVWLAVAGELVESHRVITYDLRNQGASTAAGPVAATTHGDDLEALLAHCGVERTILVADSHSGYVACQLAEQLPHRVGGVVLVDPETGTARVAARTALSRLQDEGLRELLAGDPGNEAAALQELWNDLESVLSPTAVAANLTVAAGAESDLDVAARLSCPVLLLTSDAALAEQLATTVDSARIRSIALAGPGGSPLLHDPAGFRVALAAFSASVEAATPKVIDLRDSVQLPGSVQIPVPTVGEGVFA